jgi:hypothetical protein
MNKAMCSNLASPSDANSYSVELKIVVTLLNCIHQIAFINHNVVHVITVPLLMLMLMMMIILCANNWLNGATFPGSIAVSRSILHMQTNLAPFSLFGVKYVKGYPLCREA